MKAVTANKEYTQNRIHPQKFALWLGMASIIMMFIAFTSAYIVKQGAGNWLEFQMPQIFFLNTGVIILSSLSLESSYRSFLGGKEQIYKYGLLVTFVLGIAFVALQVEGWERLFSIGMDLKGNPSGSFLYLITGVHAAHVIGGITALFVAIFHAFSLKYRITEKRTHRFGLVVQYWHFVGILWVYLLLFLTFYK